MQVQQKEARQHTASLKENPLKILHERITINNTETNIDNAFKILSLFI